ncbi:SusC/RagA family TonB-linked outer membrane protein [Neptunitalea chrysea]|uniref:SusC/RagA family TonB-linked outer membrane protein n=1 Tax=Neptunitalea chrysea TaxID=1647581 RepID=A0A9W6ET80_9FLAO|nr:SusC/RagA family TonB-linked outer membrane protein [Neptunitalea chrysea]GLB51305.1 SusC/RagA family TonB-linked outer membrane protein [Neptunitalea chrysea]
MNKIKLWLIFTLFISVFSFAQTTFTGVVYDDNQIPLPGASVVVKGTSVGVTTDFDGNFSIQVPEDNKILVVTYIGYKTYEFDITGKEKATIILVPDAAQLDEVVVTALGLKQDRKALGYASQEVKSESLKEAHETNFLNSLSGKVAGVNITNSPSGLGGSSRITIRGNSSLNINNNSPLFVIDGTPISNNVGGMNTSSTQDTDYGNGAAEINPENIESINILKGPAAAALYGSRAANGAIVITTKSGAGKKGKLKISVSSSVQLETISTMPEWQNEYGQGNNMEFSFLDGSNGGTNDGVDESWGPKLDAGYTIAQFDSPRADGTRGGDVDVSSADITPTPWVSHPDNIKDFFETGVTTINSISFAKSSELGSFRASYSNLNQTGIVPNTDLKRNNVNITSRLNLTDKLKLSSNINYIKQDSGNRPSLSYGTENVMYLWAWYGRQINTASLRDYWQPGLEGTQQFNYNYNYHDNPYFNVYENTNAQNKDRVFGNISLNYDITDHLSFMFRTGRDFYRDVRTKKRAFSTQRFPEGFYGELNVYFQEANTDFLLTYDNTFNEKWGVSLSVGANRMDQKVDNSYTYANKLVVPELYSFNNAQAGNLFVVQDDTQKRINSAYAFGRFSYDNKIYLELTGRKDWSSTVPDSYFYPSANLGLVVSQMVDLPEAFSFAKLRLAAAQVGNDTGAYNSGLTTYNKETAFGEYTVLSQDSVLLNQDLKPEMTTSYEVGTELRFFNNRLYVDATYYQNLSENQIMSVDADIASGYSKRYINLGEVKNHGFELMLGVQPIKTEKFTWDANFNFSTNESEVKDLDGVNYTLTSRNGAYIQAREGGSVSAIYGYGFKRVEDKSSPYYGRIIYNSDGLPEMTDDLVYQGDYAPDFMLGIQNKFKYKNFDLSVLFDIREGGIVVSRTKTIASTSGQLKETLVGRETGIVGDGVVESNGSYQENTVNIGARSWNYSYYDRDNVEAAKYDASYTKLREITIGYTLPAKFAEKIFLENVRFSVTGRNLFIWTENPHFDPETLSVSGNTLQPGIENMALPGVRSFTFNLNFNF